MEFNHIGLITEEPKEGESYVAATKVWVTNPHEHPFKIEWLRFEPDSPVTGPVRTEPHISWRVDDLDAAAAGLEVLLEPFDVGFAIVGFYRAADGAVEHDQPDSADQQDTAEKGPVDMQPAHKASEVAERGGPAGDQSLRITERHRSRTRGIRP